MNAKDEAVEREVARGRLVNVEFETIRKTYSHGCVQCPGPGAAVEVVDKKTNASCRVFLHDLGAQPDEEFVKMIDAAGAALDTILKCWVAPSDE
jgi:hypothetical protein